MKGIVFDEFTEMVEATFGDEMLDDIIDEHAHELPSGGAYTAVGVYDHSELIILVGALSKKTNIEVPVLVHTFGLHLAKVFAAKFPSFFEECTDTFSFLKKIDNHIHVEVYKLYPDAELPKFSFEELDNGAMNLTYESTRGFADLARGLIEGTSEYYGESFSIVADDQSVEGMQKVVFTITRE
jgi:hypothetical protein